MKSVTYKELIKKARKAGFILRRATSGSHEIWWNEKKRKTCVIPHHKEVSSGTLRNILQQMGLTEKEFNQL
ncbi:MAG: hypothetical protein A2Z42_02770 [Candidatus Woykebacteria bacterium RBG_19FT_COMBO_43_10]|uniref:Addiction module toxin, HicA family n=1 Tax=Candidatus Woykebacteria bacterium RBG_19FT_COMBO_43_10 TaxID=1802598 RepID=A0A1G1WJ53_9BACT|nr:MAG: hypothetical protein A2Z42_02770 [Candidatus Woykebacteria bacterium RBG_19FT_COMBO_43_10]